MTIGTAMAKQKLEEKPEQVVGNLAGDPVIGSWFSAQDSSQTSRASMFQQTNRSKETIAYVGSLVDVGRISLVKQKPVQK